tara:strand:- start:359 stop:607 length:249 start_codon:yes stop_codon:yes gene_type:complete
MQFAPSTYSKGVQPYHHQDPDGWSYGFLPLVAAKALLGEEEEPEPEHTVGSLALEYWWAVLLGLPVAYVAVRAGLKAAGRKK